LLLKDTPFQSFSELTNDIFELSGQTHKISLLRLFDLVYQSASVQDDNERQALAQALEQDYLRSGLKSKPKFLLALSEKMASQERSISDASRLSKRQRRH